MLLYPFPALVALFPKTFIIKGNANNERNPPLCLLPALITLFPDIAFINEEVTRCINKEAIGSINEAAIDAIIAPRNPLPYFFYFMFYCFSSTIISLKFI